MGNDDDARRNQLARRLREVEASFARQMRQRGFDPEQVENTAMPGQLAKLYAEREALRAELEETTPES